MPFLKTKMVTPPYTKQFKISSLANIIFNTDACTDFAIILVQAIVRNSIRGRAINFPLNVLWVFTLSNCLNEHYLITLLVPPSTSTSSVTRWWVARTLQTRLNDTAVPWARLTPLILGLQPCLSLLILGLADREDSVIIINMKYGI